MSGREGEEREFCDGHLTIPRAILTRQKKTETSLDLIVYTENIRILCASDS